VYMHTERLNKGEGGLLERPQLQLDQPKDANGHRGGAGGG